MTETENVLLNNKAGRQQQNVQIIPTTTDHSTKQSNGHLNVATTKSSASATSSPTDIKEPPDGGARAWCVMISAFLCNGVIFGIINCYSVINSNLQDKLRTQGYADAASKAGKIFFF